MSVRLPLFAPSFQQHRGRIYSTEDPISHKQHCQNTSTYCYWQIKKEKKICHLPPANLLRNSGRNTLFFLQMARQVAHISSHRVLDSLSRTLRGNVKDYEIQKNDQPECDLHCLHESTDPMLKFPFPANTVNKQSSKGVAEHRSGRLIN